MAIPVVDTLPIAPSDERPSTFDAEMFAFLQAMQPFPGQLNALVPFLALAAGRSAISAVYTFVGATSGDPGAGNFRLNNATQGSATGAGLDLLDANGVDVTTIVARMGAGTSDVKGDLLVTRAGDPTVWLSGEVTSATSPSGYRSLVLQNVAVSAANPFTVGDQVLVTYVRTGGKGDTGATGDIGPHAVYEEQRASGNSLTTNTAGAHNTVALNTEVLDTLGIFSLSGSDIVIGAAGTYWIEGLISAVGVQSFQPNLYNVTDGVVIKAGLNGSAMDLGSAYYTSGGYVPVAAQVTITSAKTIRLRVYISAAATSSAYGVTNGSGLGQVYARLTITKKS